MPKPNVVFRAALEEESTSEDEIVFVPYTKPPPVVIDLGSESEDEPTKENSNKTPKKKKKKKHKKDKERDSNRPTDVASLGTPTDSTNHNSSVSLPDHGRKDGDCLSDIEICEVLSSGSQDVEPDTSHEVAPGSEVVAADSNTSLASASTTTSSNLTSSLDKHLEVASGLSSNFDKCLDDQSTSTEVGEGCSGTKTGVSMAGSTSAQDKDKDKRAKSKERKSNREGKSRTRTLSATQRTNEEIVNFLTTLGIQMEPSSFETPPTRRRQPRKRQAPNVLDGEVNSMDSSATNSNDGQNFPAPLTEVRPSGAFVSVTQDLNASAPLNSTPNSGQGHRRRQAISGDISDYSVSFTNKDLNDVLTSFQTNVVMTGANNKLGDNGYLSVSSIDKKKQRSSLNTTKLNYYAEVIDAVAKGLDTPSVLSSISYSDPGAKLISPSTSKSATVSGASVIENNSAVKISTNMNTECSSGQQPDNNIELTKTHSDDDTSNADQICHPLSTPNQPEVIEETTTRETQKDSNDGEKHENQNYEGTEKTAGINMPTLLSRDSNTSSISADAVVNLVSVDSTLGSSNISHLESLPLAALDITENTKSEKKRKLCDVEMTESSVNNDRHNNVNIRGEAKGYEKERVTRRSPERKRQRPNKDSILPRHGSDIAKGRKSDIKENCDSGASIVEYPLTTNSVTVNIPHESYYPSTWSNHMRDFYGSFCNENFELDEVLQSLPDSKGCWKVSKDLMPPPGSKRRRVRCDNCKQFGHLIKECREKWKLPICHYCGKVGHTSDNHSSRHNRNCPSALCLNCGRRLSRFAQKCHKCLLVNRPSRCQICNVMGHEEQICPDSWRRYYSVTSVDEYEREEAMLKNNSKDAVSSRQKHTSKNSNNFKRSSAMFCANCGERGHSYYDCDSSKFGPYPRNKPFIIREVQMDVPALTSSSTLNSTCLPASYDSQTGRTVVINSDNINQPVLAVETIQVQITNELAFENQDVSVSSVQSERIEATTTDYFGEKEKTENAFFIQEPSKKFDSTASYTRRSVDSAKTSGLSQMNKKYICIDRRCSNKLKKNESCYLTLMDTQSHLQLRKAHQNGFLKWLEEKHQVQIAIIDDGYKIHICGTNVVEADIDLYRLLQTNMRPSKPIYRRSITHLNDIDCKESHQNKLQLTRQREEERTDNPDTITTTDKVTVVDEEECCVIEEIPVKGSKQSQSATSSVSPSLTNKSTFPTNEKIHQNDAEINEPQSELLCLESRGTVDETNIEKKDTNKKSTWSEYVSPLTGLSLSLNCENSTKTDMNDNNHNTTYKEGIDTSEPVNVDRRGTKESSPELFEYDEIDYSCFTVGLQNEGEIDKTKVINSDESTYSSDSDVEIVEATTADKNVEIITIDDDEEKPQYPNVCSPAEERIRLHKSEWTIAKSDEWRKNGIIKQLMQEFGIKISLDDGTTTVIIHGGSEKNRRLAKDECLAWLESKCLNTDYHLVRRTPNSIETSTPCNRNKKFKQRVLNLSDVQQNMFGGKPRPHKRKRSKSKMPGSKNFNMNNNSPQTPSKSPHSNLPSPVSSKATKQFYNKRKSKKTGPATSPFKSKGLTQPQIPKTPQKGDFTKTGSDFSDAKLRKRYFQK